MKMSKFLRSMFLITFAMMLTANATPTRRALLVGLNNYSLAYGPSSLRGCVNDAIGIRDTAMLGDEDLRWPSANVQLLTDSRATKFAIRTALQSLAAQSSAGDTVVYFQSSHGGQEIGTSTYLCTYNANYSDDELGADLALFDSSVNVIVIVDACHSGGLFKGVGSWPFIDNVMTSYRETKSGILSKSGLPVPKDFGTNIAFMVACDYDELSYEDSSSGMPYGRYTYALLASCALATADTDYDGDLQFMEMFNYAASRTADSQTAQYLNSTLLSSVAVRTAGFGVQIDDRYEENDTIESAYDLSAYSGTWLSSVDGLGVQYDQDWYEIYADPGVESIQINCQFTNEDGDIDLALYDAYGNLLARSQGTSNSEAINYALTSQDGGVFYIQVYYGNQGNTYDLRWTAILDDKYEHNDSLATAYDLTANEQTWLSSINGLGIQYDQDWYKIYVSPGSERVQVDCQFTHSAGNINLSLYNASGTAVAFSSSNDDNEFIDYALPSSVGAYYYVLVSYGNKGNTYDLWWDDVTREPKPDLVVQSITHSPENPTPGDTVTFTVTVKNQGLAASSGLFTTGFFRNRSSAPLITTTPDQTKNYLSGIAVDATCNLTFQIVAPSVGSYKAWAYVDRYSLGVGEISEVDETNNAGPLGGHAWTVRGFSDDLYEENDTLASAYDLTAHEQKWLSSINGLGVQADSDWYKIYVNPGAERVWVDCRFKNNLGDINIMLCNASGTRLASSAGVGDSEFIDFIVPSGGAYYYIAVQGANSGNTYDLWWDGLSPLSRVYRFWSDQFNGHFYTISQKECDGIIANLSTYWKYEGVAYYAFPARIRSSFPVYRFWSAQFKGHFYTINEAERNNVTAKLSKYWRDEGVAFYAYPTQVVGTVPVYRFWSPVFAHHFFTISETEKNHVAAKLSKYWQYEGVAFYAFPSADLSVLDVADRTSKEAQATISRSATPETTDDQVGASVQNGINGSAVIFPLYYPERDVSAYVYDSIADTWHCVLETTNSPALVTVPEVQSDCRYLLEVFASDPESGELSSVHRSWFETRLDAPAQIREGDAVVEQTDGVGCPIVRMQPPIADGTMTLKLYSSTEGVIETQEDVPSGEAVEFSLPDWNRWYWIGGWRDDDQKLVVSLWLRHETLE